MSFFLRSFMLALLVFTSASVIAKDQPDTKAEPLMILGWVENAYLLEPKIELKAKLDSGAKTSSLDARIVKLFRQGGKRWVRFAVTDPETGKETIMVRERQRTIGIIQHEGANEIRPTVNIEICIAGMEKDIEVSLVDRENFNYPLLMGRRALKHIAVIHPGETFISNSSCLAKKDIKDDVARPSKEESANEQDDTDGTVDEVESTGEQEKSGSHEEKSDRH